MAGRVGRVPSLVHLEGTLLLSWYLRAMGMKLGKRVVLGPGFAQVVDPDMLIVEDDATVSAMFQAHTFEDRVLKMDYVHVRRGRNAGHGVGAALRGGHRRGRVRGAAQRGDEG
jgi:hypothetical protein